MVERRRRLWRRSLPGGVVLEALLVVVVCSLRRVPAPAPAFARLQRLGCIGRRLGGCFAALFTGGYFAAICFGGCFAAIVVLVIVLADALPSSWVGWMLCHLYCVADPSTLSVVIFFCRFQLRSCLGSRGCSCLPCFSCCSYLFLGRLPPTWWWLYFRLNSLCLFRFVLVLLFFS